MTTLRPVNIILFFTLVNLFLTFEHYTFTDEYATYEISVCGMDAEDVPDGISRSDCTSRSTKLATENYEPPSSDCINCAPPVIEGGESKCPNDSRLVHTSQPDNCCESTSTACICNECLKPRCPLNQSVQIISFGNQRPGSCCHTFQCLQTDSGFCTFDGSSHKDTEVWSPDKCNTCRCEKGLVYCTREECVPPAGCGYMFTPENECCPVCGGCMSENRFFTHNQTWLEAEGCFKCSCEHGRARCIAEYCVKPPCSNPVKLPDVCCPVCLGATDVPAAVINRTCPVDQYPCTRACEFGYLTDEQGCNLCKCDRLRCNSILCQHGFAVQDDSLRRSCQCLPRPSCTLLTNCDRLCPFGFAEDERGCLVCECKNSPQRLQGCNLDCPNGFEVDVEGRGVCKCVSEDTGLSIFASCHSGGRTYASGEIYFDGCRQCHCSNGLERCVLISCPLLSCATPIWIEGQCCPICADDTPRPPITSTELCRKLSGDLLPDGELIVIDNCTSCVCLMGLAFCDVAICPPIQCSSRQIRLGSCCTLCNETLERAIEPYEPDIYDRVGDAMQCFHKGSIHADGDVWKPDTCQSCTCKKGTSYCYPEICPQITCANPVVKKGTCCPFCLEGAKMSVCVFDGKAYQNGDSWNVGDCSNCKCVDGQIICTRTLCPAIRCVKTAIIPGNCCPICLDNVHSISTAVISKPPFEPQKISSINLTIVHSLLLGAIVLLVSVIAVLIYLIIKRGNLFIFQQRINNSTFGPSQSSPDRSSIVSPESSDYRYIKYYIIGGSSKAVGGATVGITQRTSLLGDLTDSVAQLGSSDMALSSWDDCTCSDSRLRSNQDLIGSALASPQHYQIPDDKSIPSNPSVIYV
ncbi:hypothetical protein ACOME3_003774 [Neoechinorhynchus agilis]